MCGIVTLITRSTFGLDFEERKMFTNMLFADTLRGWDSTGVFGVSNKGNVQIHKEACDGPTFIKTKEFDTFMGDAVARGSILVGHNRAATRGQINDENAHPFWVDDKIVLVQNGTWVGSHKHVKDTEVDTEAIAHLIATEDSIDSALKQINAAYALVWYNVAEKTLYAVRNTQRPLCIAYTEKHGILIASETATINFAVQRSGVALQSPAYEITDGQLLSFKLNDDKTIDADVRKIDTTYQFKSYYMGTGYDTQARLPYHPYNYDEDDSLDVMANRYRRRFAGNDEVGMDSPRFKSGGQSDRLKENQVGITLFHHVSNGRFPDNEMSSKDGDKESEKFMNFPDSRKGVVVEVFEYIPANNFKDCQAWYVLCHQITADNNKVLFYKLEKDKTEEEILELVGKIYRGDVTSMQKMPCREKGRVVCAQMMSALVEVPVLLTEVKNAH